MIHHKNSFIFFFNFIFILLQFASTPTRRL